MSGSKKEEMRSLLKRMEECFEKWLEERRATLIVLALPTGYGKTRIATRLLARAAEHGLRGAYVAPLRVLIKQAYRWAKEEARGVDAEDIAYQAGLSIAEVAEMLSSEADGDTVKAPFMERMVNITTLDSFAMNFLGVPVAEAWRGSWHSDVAFTFTHTLDVLILDEVHLMISEGEGSGGAKLEELRSDQLELIARASAATLARRGLVVLSTATMPPTLVREILERAIEEYGERIDGKGELVVKLICLRDFGLCEPLKETLEDLRKRERRVEVKVDVESIVEDDEKFTGRYCSSIGVKLVEVNYDGELFEKIKEELRKLDQRVKKVALVFNHVSRAVKIYKRLSEEQGLCDKVVLVHSRLTERDRRLAESEVVASGKGSSRLCVVATQVVEAGLDANFDVLITDAAPLSSLIQRAGRVARPGHVDRVDSSLHKVVILVPSQQEYSVVSRGVYSEDEVRKAIDTIREVLRDRSGVDFRCLSELGDKLGGGGRDAARSSGSDLISELEYLLLSPKYIMEKLFTELRGSFVREAALVPILVIRDDEYERLYESSTRGEEVDASELQWIRESTLTVPHYIAEWLAREKHLVMEGDDRVLALVAYHRIGSGKVRLYFDKIKVGRDEEWLLRYLYRLWVRSATSSARGVRIELLGLLMRDKEYRELLNPSRGG